MSRTRRPTAGTIRRLVVLVAGVTGLLAWLGAVAEAGLGGHQHAEPLVRR